MKIAVSAPRRESVRNRSLDADVAGSRGGKLPNSDKTPTRQRCAHDLYRAPPQWLERYERSSKEGGAAALEALKNAPTLAIALAPAVL